MLGNARNAASRPRDVGHSIDDALLCRKGADWQRQLLVLIALTIVAVVLVRIVGSVETWATHRLEVLLTLGGIAFWRWSWFAIQNGRAIIYRFWVFPRLRRQALQSIAEFGPVPEGHGPRHHLSRETMDYIRCIRIHFSRA